MYTQHPDIFEFTIDVSKLATGIHQGSWTWVYLGNDSHNAADQALYEQKNRF